MHVVTYPTAQHLVPVERIAIQRAPKLPGLWTTRPLGWQKVVLDLLLIWVLYRVVRDERIQVIHAHNIEGPLVAFVVRWLTGVPVVYHAHNALSDELPCYARSRFGGWLAVWLGAYVDRRIAGAADYSIALSDRLGAFLAMRGAAGRVAVIPPGVGRIKGAGGERPPRASGALVMYAGNLDAYQDLDVLLDGFARVRALTPSARLVLVTHRGAEATERGRAAEWRAHPGVEVVVAATFAAAVRALRAADVVVCPRGSWSGFPIKVLNYMRLGLPVVHARASAHSIEHEVSGLLFDDRKAAALAEAVLRVLRDRKLGERLGRQARAVARERHAWGGLLPRVAAVYESVTGGTGT